MHLAKHSHIIFDFCLVLVFLLSLALASFPGTVRERIMRFCWMWPMDNGSETKPNKLSHALWITRQIIQVFVIGYCMVAAEIITVRMFHNEKEPLRYNAFRMYFGAAFCEEFFKFFIAASIPFISKYSKSKSAILHVCIVVGLAFDLVENIKYSSMPPYSVGGWKSMRRIIGFCAHFVFAYPTALAITRQRDSILWILEVLGGFSLGVLLHGSFNYLTTIGLLGRSISLFLLMPGFLIIGLYILIKNPFLPKDELAQNVNCIPHNRMHTGNTNYVPNTRNPPNRVVDV
jgi:RsiW-degrading membrane proteinase PrsW (M82 family)